MWQDPIVAETRALRDDYARQFNYDIDAMFEDLMAKQAEHPERLVSFSPRRPAAPLEEETTETVHSSALDVLARAPGQRLFQTAEAVDSHLRKERDAWER